MDTTTAETLLTVHRTDHEGVLQVNALTGIITTPNDERPDWAEGLTCALLAEHKQFYASRLGEAGVKLASETAEMLNYEDLGWIGVDEDGNEVEIEAQAEFRMNLIADLIGVDRETGEITGGKVLAEAEIAMDRNRTPEEAAAFEHSQEVGFDKATGTA